LVAACRKVSRYATVAWRRRNIFKDMRTQGDYGPWQKLGAVRIMVTLRAKLAQRKGTFARKKRFGAKVDCWRRNRKIRGKDNKVPVREHLISARKQHISTIL
jgi:hypothetical protein